MKYYEEHEKAYQQLIDEGYFGWGKKESIEDLLNFGWKSELDQMLAPFLKKTAARILDVGCGTGAVAFHFAGQHDVSGIDISATAIDAARMIAREIDRPVKFIADDFLFAELLPGSFDLIVDSSFLHCIVFDEDRRNCFRRIQELLSAEGLFAVHTMVADTAVNFGRDYDLDANGVLWYLSQKSEVREAKAHGERVATPQRRVLKAESIHAELKVSGMKLLDSKILPGNGADTPDRLLALYQKAPDL